MWTLPPGHRGIFLFSPGLSWNVIWSETLNLHTFSSIASFPPSPRSFPSASYAFSSQHLSPSCVLSRFSQVQLFVTLWSIASQAPLSVGFSSSPGRNTGVGCHFLPPGDLPNPGAEHMSLTSSALAREFFTTSTTWGGYHHLMCLIFICLPTH